MTMNVLLAFSAASGGDCGAPNKDARQDAPDYENKQMHNPIAELVRTTLLIIGALFPIVNTPENIPVFLSLTEGLSRESRSMLARKIAVNGFALLVVSVLIGTHILAFFGISLPVVQVGGGLVVTAAGWKLLSQPDDDDQAPKPSLKTPKDSYLTRRAFFPLTLPLTVGPGSISVAIAVGANRPPGSEAHWYLPVAAVLGCVILALTIYLVYRFAEPIGRILGDTAMNIVIRLSSFILLCIGVQIIWNGASKLLSAVF
jgi:multiple antibiotic resistance protein